MFGVERGYDYRKTRRRRGVVHFSGAVNVTAQSCGKEYLLVASHLGNIIEILLAGCPFILLGIHENSDCHDDNADDDNRGAYDFHGCSSK